MPSKKKHEPNEKLPTNTKPSVPDFSRMLTDSEIQSLKKSTKEARKLAEKRWGKVKIL